MLYSGKKNIPTLVLSEKNILNDTKNHNYPPPPFQVKWSVPYGSWIGLSNTYVSMCITSSMIQRYVLISATWFGVRYQGK